VYSEPDWDEVRSVVRGRGPRTAERLEFRRSSREETEWVRRVMLAEAA
jgi:ring-1,2-phenylacetyl-CoA epoxidase subunit PaaA